MKERPILFSAPMVRALLDGSKTQTRRVVKPRDLAWMDEHQGLREPDNAIRCPYGVRGDRLWVREAWSTHACFDHLAPRDCPKSIHYTADGKVQTGKGRPSIHMPRWASRIDLEVTSVRVERLQDISEADAIAEGIERLESPHPGVALFRDYALGHDSTVSPIHSYSTLWGSINGAGSWAANPWAWVVEFRRIRP